MASFLVSALQSADIEAACKSQGLGIGEYLIARRKDPAFELACLEIDLIARQAAVATLEAAAARGDLNASKLKLLLAGIASLRVDEGDGPGGVASLPLDSPPWLAGLVASVVGSRPNLGILGAVWAAYVAASKFFGANPKAHPLAFSPPGPCLDCCSGLMVECPHCTVVFLARSNLGPELPLGGFVGDLKVSRGEPVAEPLLGWFQGTDPDPDDEGEDEGEELAGDLVVDELAGDDPGQGGRSRDGL